MEQTKLTNIFKEINILQCQEEIEWLFEKLNKRDLNFVVEIGIWNGGSVKLWDEYLHERYPNEKKDILGIDIDMGNLQWDVNTAYNTMHLMTADTRTEEFINQYKNLYGDRKIDFLFIDGDHGYAAAKNDFETMLPFVADGGIIAFHDINTEAKNVGRFFNEVQGFTKDEIKRVQGIGIIIK